MKQIYQINLTFLFKDANNKVQIKMQNQLIDLNLFLPKFYPKSQQITLKLNPILENVREANIVSFHQLQNKASFSKQLETLSLDTINTPKKNHHKDLSILEKNQSIFDNNKTELNFAKTIYGSNFSSQKNRKKLYSTLQTPSTSAKPNRIRQDSLYVRSKTSDKVKSKNTQLLMPGTADLAKDVQQLDLQKLNIFIKNPENQIDFDDDLCNYIRLKMLIKNPYFSGGKQSKIKKHLVEYINLEQIQKKFFKSTASNTKYKEFFKNIMHRKRHNSFVLDKFSKTIPTNLFPTKNTIPKSPSKQEKPTEKVNIEFNFSKYSQNIDREDSPFSIHGISQQRSKKLALKAKVLFGKSQIQAKSPLGMNDDTDLVSSHEFSIEVQGKSQSPTLQKYLETRNKKFNIQKGLMKRAYKMEHA